MFPSAGAITTQVNTVGLPAKRHYLSSKTFVHPRLVVIIYHDGIALKNRSYFSCSRHGLAKQKRVKHLSAGHGSGVTKRIDAGFEVIAVAPGDALITNSCTNHPRRMLKRRIAPHTSYHTNQKCTMMIFPNFIYRLTVDTYPSNFIRLRPNTPNRTRTGTLLVRRSAWVENQTS